MVHIIEVLRETPSIAWLGLLYSLYIGIRAMGARDVFVPRLFAVPVLFVILKYKMFARVDFFSLLIYFSCLSLTTMLGALVAIKTSLEISSKKWTVSVPPTPWTLPIILLFFATKYAFSFLKATNLDLYNQLVILEICLSAAISGFFLGKALGYSFTYIKKLEKQRGSLNDLCFQEAWGATRSPLRVCTGSGGVC